jgi:hypothetical protein
MAIIEPKVLPLGAVASSHTAPLSDTVVEQGVPPKTLIIGSNDVSVSCDVEESDDDSHRKTPTVQYEPISKAHIGQQVVVGPSSFLTPLTLISTVKTLRLHKRDGFH